MRTQPVVVVGCGVSGLTTAVCLAEAGHPVRIWAAELPRRTTSVVAGAVCGPLFAEPVAKTLAWTERSLVEFRELARDPATGVRMAPAVGVSELPSTGELPPKVKLIPELRPCDPAKIPAGFQAGFQATMPLVDMPRYLDYLVGRLASLDVEIEIRTVASLAEAAKVAPIVVNCSGLGARELASDQDVCPVFGQHVVLTNPGLDEFFVELGTGWEWTCYFPHPGRVVCGGTRVAGRWDTRADPELTERILHRCRRVQPRLCDAEVIDVVTGLRPDRPAVRVEAEPLGSARCIHNYGHGSGGVSVSWGCAREVVELARPTAAGRVVDPGQRSGEYV